MKIKHHEIIPDKEKPFAECKLNREQNAKVLTDIVRTYADGFVLAINNEWGTGKTTFVKMWQQQLKNEGFQTVYFNAWENDFDNNPLIALMSELATLTNAKNEKIYKSVLKKGGVLIRNIAPALAKSLMKKYLVDLDDVAESLIENATKASTEILENEIKEYSSKKKTISEFRGELEKFVKTHGTEKPLVFIIDELDRCRPNYSVEVLEQVKHFFAVPGIVFVLSIDKSHLASAVRGFYGSEQINTDEYLRRFIDLEYSIPKPTISDYSRYLFGYFELDKILSHLNRRDEADLLLKTADLLFIKSNATLRQQEKIFAQVRLIIQTFSPNHHLFSHILFVLVFIKTMKNQLFHKIENGILTMQELCDEFEELMPSNIEDYYSINITYVEAELLFLYSNNGENYHDKSRKNDVDSNGKLNENIRSKTCDPNLNQLKSYFDDIGSQMFNKRIDIDYLLAKINLLQPIQLS